MKAPITFLFTDTNAIIDINNINNNNNSERLIIPICHITATLTASFPLKVFFGGGSNAQV